MSFGCKWPSGTPDLQPAADRWVQLYLDKNWTVVTGYSTDSWMWSPEKRLGSSDFLQYNWLEVVTREVGGKV